MVQVMAWCHQSQVLENVDVKSISSIVFFWQICGQEMSVWPSDVIWQHIDNSSLSFPKRTVSPAITMRMVRKGHGYILISTMNIDNQIVKVIVDEFVSYWQLHPVMTKLASWQLSISHVRVCVLWALTLWYPCSQWRPSSIATLTDVVVSWYSSLSCYSLMLFLLLLWRMSWETTCYFRPWGQLNRPVVLFVIRSVIARPLWT